jgi:hypothetical protein
MKTLEVTRSIATDRVLGLSRRTIELRVESVVVSGLLLNETLEPPPCTEPAGGIEGFDLMRLQGLEYPLQLLGLGARKRQADAA